MGRLSQAIDFLNRKPLPPPHERNIIYTKISDEVALKSLRNRLSLPCTEKLGENEIPFES
jgi:hypothetical protein